jgi:hypothetical protein
LASANLLTAPKQYGLQRPYRLTKAFVDQLLLVTLSPMRYRTRSGSPMTPTSSLPLNHYYKILFCPLIFEPMLRICSPLNC